MIRKIKFKQFMRKNVAQNKQVQKVWIIHYSLIRIIILTPYRYSYNLSMIMDTKSIFSINTNLTGFKATSINGLPSQLI